MLLADRPNRHICKSKYQVDIRVEGYYYSFVWLFGDERSNTMKLHKWIVAPLIVIVLLVVIVLTTNSNPSENKIDLSLESLTVANHPNEGEGVLAECAKTACVAVKANELAAKAAAAAQAAQMAAQEQTQVYEQYSPPRTYQNQASPSPQPVGPPQVVITEVSCYGAGCPIVCGPCWPIP